MSSPDPVKPSAAPSTNTGWKPTTSTYAGAGIGGAVSTVTLWMASVIWPHLVIPAVVGAAWGVICGGLCGYFFPDGGRK